MTKGVRKEYVGEIIETPSSGKFKVLRELIPIGYPPKTRLFEIEFIDTGYRTIITAQSCARPNVKDRLLPTVYGVGKIGQHDIFLTYERSQTLYKIWECMISRCYNPKDLHYDNYGGIGVRVADEWLEFRRFEQDVKMKPNYDRKLADPTMYHLDKDYLQRNIPTSQRVYSNSTTLWISMYENALMKGLDNGAIKYFGVLFSNRYNKFITRIYHNEYASFETAEEAAMMFNYIYPLVGYKNYMTVPIVNEVPYIPFYELCSRNKSPNLKHMVELLAFIQANNIQM